MVEKVKSAPKCDEPIGEGFATQLIKFMSDFGYYVFDGIFDCFSENGWDLAVDFVGVPGSAFREGLPVGSPNEWV